MSRFCPVYPKPATKGSASLLTTFLRGRRSWLDILFDRNYRAKLMQVRFPGVELFLVNGPAEVRRVMVQDYERFPKHTLLGKILEPLLGESIFTTNGAVWQRQRRMMDPAFEQARIKLVFSLMNAAAVAMEQRLDRLPSGADYDIDVEMTHVTADIIFRTILSLPMEGADARRVFEAFIQFQELSQRIAVRNMYHLPQWLSRDARRHREAGREIRGLLEKLIRVRYDAFKRGDPEQPQDILGSLMAMVDPVNGQPFNFTELVDQVAMLFLAGHETSASALSWALYLISRDQETQRRMQTEVATVVGERDPEFTDIKKMSFCADVFRETLRLYPPVGFFSREASEACQMRGKEIAKGSTVVVSPWLIQRHRELWERPDEFDPDRYADDASKESLRNAYLPFGAGPRVCIGAAFAMQEAVLILARLVRRYHFEAVPGHEPDPVGRLTVRSENGVRLRITRRTR